MTLDHSEPSGKRKRDLSSYKIKVPKQKAFEVETPDDQVKMHQLLLAVAKKGSGKSTAVCNLLHFLKKDKVMDRLFVITSSWESNKPLFDFLKLPIDRDDVYNPDDDPKQVIGDIIEKIRDETRDYEDYKRKRLLYEKMRKAMKHVKADRDIMNMEPELLIATYDNDVLEQPPLHRYGGKLPVLAIFVDDAQSTRLFRSDKFLNLCIKHRHVGSSEDTRMGVSMFICVQNYTAQLGGIPKAIRDNVTTMMLYKTRSGAVLKTIMEDISDSITDEEFLNVYNAACKDKHDFLFIDWEPKKHRFRRNFDEYLPVASDPVSDVTGAGRDPSAAGSRLEAGDQTAQGKIARGTKSEISRRAGFGLPSARQISR